jgi:hypothetical protein
MHCGRLDLSTGTCEGLDISFPEEHPNLPESSHTDIQFLPRSKYSPSPWRCCVWIKLPLTVRNAQINEYNTYAKCNLLMSEQAVQVVIAALTQQINVQ